MRKVMRERHLTFKEAVNAAILDGLAPQSVKPAFSTPTFDLGRSTVNLDRALALAGELRKRVVGK